MGILYPRSFAERKTTTTYFPNLRTACPTKLFNDSSTRCFVGSVVELRGIKMKSNPLGNSC